MKIKKIKKNWLAGQGVRSKSARRKLHGGIVKDVGFWEE